MCLSINTRKTIAMGSLEKLNYNGDVHACEVDSMKKIREVFEAKVTIEDVILISRGTVRTEIFFLLL